MSKLIALDNISLAYGLEPLLDEVKFQIEKGERVCLIGRNGAGKSSLLKIIDGTLLPDSGTVWRKSNLRFARLEQELPRDPQTTVYEFVAGGLEAAGKVLTEYHQLTLRLTEDASDRDMARLQDLQQQMDTQNAWHFEQTIKTTLTRLDLDPDKQIKDLSGGWQRRAALAKALVSDPELLLLDEPTNHLDIEAIQWLEEQLINCGCGLLFVTHDRALLQRLATRIIELDRGNLTSWPGDYQNFLRRKDELLHAEAKQNADFDKKLAQEERWIRQGIKARRTRNEGRVRSLEEMRRTRAKRREMQGQAEFNINEAEKSGQLVLEAKNISHGFHGKSIIKDFSLRIMRGDRIGLIGPNGVGKSTLLNILLAKLTPDQGELIQGTKLQIAYFDQLRLHLDPDKTVIENVVEGSDTIEVNGKQQHIISYLNDFLFTPQRAMTPVRALSGGECNRLLLARLFSQPANLLVMDEPTNDLDIETLELLEELLSNYNSTLLLVSHDRAFLDNVVTSTLVFTGEGKITEFIGGYQDWLQQNKNMAATKKNQIVKDRVPPIMDAAKKLTFKEQKELNELPKKIEALEAEQNKLQMQIANAQFYKQDADEITATLTKLKTLGTELESAYERWNELDFIQNLVNKK